ncbi:hypothetical protein L1987_34127 [Smallanthus sonchifolius]|uniref:Uncharacterized protein n=1 Tax=Smallanthus sonchifolius TaxID=185202 RepID=A0ACB9HSZ8_9ASTR|nr:hypothetical protein L1987_34127 [Smallanthus sonchifolius]
MKHRCTYYIPKFIWKTIVGASTAALAAMFTIHGLLRRRHHHDFINMSLTIFFILVLALISVSMVVSAVKDLLHLKFIIFKTSASVAEHDETQMEDKQAVIASEQV